MAHELEFINGEASYVGREPGWHRLGTVIEDLSYEDALEKGHLAGWNVSTYPLTAAFGRQHVEVPGRVVVYRKHPETGDIDPLGVAGDDYTATQNEQAFAVAGPLEDMGWTVETAGSIRGGKQVFLTLKPSGGRRIVIDKDGVKDEIDAFILLTTSHDGSLANEASATGVRVVCANTLDYALPGAKRAYKVRHTKNVEVRLAEAQEIFLRAQGYFTALADEAERLLKVEVTNAEFQKIVGSLFAQPDEEKKAAHTRWTNKVDLLGDIWSGGNVDVQFSNAGITGTAWGAEQTLIEFLDWHRTGRGENKEETLAIARMGLDPNITAMKGKVRSTVLSFAKEKAPKVFA